MTLVKICGLTALDDVIAATEAGADFLGFIFYEKSPRAVSIEQVAGFTEAIRGLEVPRVPLCVGVFVNPTVAQVLETLERCQLQAAQVHRIAPPLLRELLDQTQGWVYPAIQPRSFAEAIGALPTGKADEDDAENGTIGGAPWIPQLLIDAFHPDMPGGTGQRADLGIARRVAAGVSRLMLAGGLTSKNVSTAIQTVRPWAVDVSSGVEAAPGRKDHEKVHAFIHAVRQFDEEFV